MFIVGLFLSLSLCLSGVVVLLCYPAPAALTGGVTLRLIFISLPCEMLTLRGS